MEKFGRREDTVGERMSTGDTLELLSEEYEPHVGDGALIVHPPAIVPCSHRQPPPPGHQSQSIMSTDPAEPALTRSSLTPLGEFLPSVGFGPSSPHPPGTYAVGNVYPKTPCNIDLRPPEHLQSSRGPGHPAQVQGHGPDPSVLPPPYSCAIAQEGAPLEDRPPEYEVSPEMVAASSWEKVVRQAFIRKVFLVLTAQMLVTVAVVAVFTYVEPVMFYVRQHPLLYYASFVIYLVSAIALICCGDLRRNFPCNIITLAIITLAVSFMVGTIASRYTTQSVFTAAGITLAVCFVIVVFSMQTKYDFTCCIWIMLPLMTCLFFFALLAVVFRSNIMFVVWGSLGAVIFSLFLAVDVQLILGNKQFNLSPEEYIFAALCLYLDVVKIFLYLLMALGGRK